jgi:large subunit ribosomal protein L28
MAKLTLEDLQFNRVAHKGHNVSHAKNRTNRTFSRNLHRVSVLIGGKKRRVEVSSRVLKTLKRQGLVVKTWVKKVVEK